MPRSSSGRSLIGSIRDKMSKKPSSRPDGSDTEHASTSRDPSSRRPHQETSPPSYVEATATTTAAPYSAAPFAVSTADDPYAFLSTFDTVFLIDDSGSMRGRSWAETGAALRAIAPVCAAHDADGLDVYFLNARSPAASEAGGGSQAAGGYLRLRGADAVEQLFTTVRPGGGTPTGTRIQAILGPYVTAFERAVSAAGGDPDAASRALKPLNLIVVTDGVPTDDPESVLLGLARRLDAAKAPPYQVGVQFFQVGHERGAREALQELDDCLGREAGVRDMVDMTSWDGRPGSRYELSADGILKAVLGGVVKRLDRKKVRGQVS